MSCNITTIGTNISDNANVCVTNGTTTYGWTAPEFQVTVKTAFLVIILTTLVGVTIFGNLLVLVSFAVERRLLRPFNLFILNLAVTDFLVAITAMPFYTIDTLLGYWPFGNIMCGVWIYFDFAMTFASVFTLVAISIDRFWCVTWAIHYKLHNNRTRTSLILVLIWLCVIAIWTPPFIHDRMEHNEAHSCIWEPSDNTEFVIFVAVIGHYTPCTIMVFCYFKVFWVMRRRTALVGVNEPHARSSQVSTIAIQVQQAGTSNGRNTSSRRNESSQHEDDNHLKVNSLQLHPDSNLRSISTPSRTNNELTTRSKHNRYASRSNSTRDRRAFITLSYVLCSYLICWFPFYIVFDTYAWKPEALPPDLYTVFFWFTYVNSSINPFIYAYTSKEFRLAFVKVLTSFYCC